MATHRICECGCKKSYPEMSMVKIPTGNKDHPVEYIYAPHAAEIYGATYGIEVMLSPQPSKHTRPEGWFKKWLQFIRERLFILR